jgi:hypothetical protein
MACSLWARYSLRHNPRPQLAVVAMCLGIFLAFASAGQFLLGQLNLSRAVNDLRGQIIGFGRGGEPKLATRA